MAGKVRTSIKLDEEVKTEAQIKALRNKITLQEVVERFLRAWVQEDLKLPDSHEEGLRGKPLSTS